MIFLPELAEAIVAGHKTVTRRKRDGDRPCRYKPGHTYAVQPGRGKHGICRIEIVSVTPETFDPLSITNAEARLEGFDWAQLDTPADAFCRRWRSIHRTLLPVDVWRIEFKLAQEGGKA